MEHQADTVIGVEVQVKGNLQNKGSILVNGNVEGEIKSDENVTVGETATVTGPIVAKSILISGKVNGTVEAAEKLEVDPTGLINGDIKTKILIVREGAVFNGNSSMGQSPKENVSVSMPIPEKEVKTAEVEQKEEIKGVAKSSFWDKNKK
ncbi:MAG: Polymer-forming cytoskeletal [bacterium ADurb.Bin212]|nr:MAG: Polymer-forming cytoskeletal [bacterium ADurb.Bin212]